MGAPIPFRGFDDRRPVRVYRHGLLPHWRQDGCTYFVTFRLADSLPAGVRREFEFQRRVWLARRGVEPARAGAAVRLTEGDRRRYRRWVAAALNGLLDAGHGSCVLRSREASAVVVHALDHLDGRTARVGDFVTMPNHVHALLTPLPGRRLEDVLHSVKSFTANRLNRLTGRTGRLWQRESYDHIVRDPEQLGAFQAYIAASPSRAGLRDGEFSHKAATYDFTDPIP